MIQKFFKRRGERLQFLDFQLDLIDEFRLRLAQLKRDDSADALNSDLPAILNTVHYICSVLLEWGSDMVSVEKPVNLYNLWKLIVVLPFILPAFLDATSFQDPNQ